MRQENPTLSIKDIVLLKERPQDYYKLQDRLTKTHDGTSSGPINAHIKEFIYENINSPFRCVSVFNENGKLLKYEDEGLEDENQREAPVYSKEDLEQMGTNNHIIYKPTGQDNEGHLWSKLPYSNYDNRYTEPDRYLEVPNEDDLERLTYTNEDGEQLVRSITMLSSAGEDSKSTVTIIKNNNFSSENNEALMNAGKKLNDVIEKYESEKWDIDREITNKWKKEVVGIDEDESFYIDEDGKKRSYLYHPDYRRMSKERYETIQSRMPDIYTYIENNGVYDDFEDANAKLKIRKNDNAEVKPQKRYNQNQNYYEDLWSETYGELYSEPYDEPY